MSFKVGDVITTPGGYSRRILKIDFDKFNREYVVYESLVPRRKNGQWYDLKEFTKGIKINEYCDVCWIKAFKQWARKK